LTDVKPDEEFAVLKPALFICVNLVSKYILQYQIIHDDIGHLDNIGVFFI